MTTTTGIRYRTGDATKPVHRKIIAHVCNDQGEWGAGFVLALSKRWSAPEASYRAWYRNRATAGFHLGAVDFVVVDDDTAVANMIAQRGFYVPGEPAVDYTALRSCLTLVAKEALHHGASVHMPRIGCGLGGGTWDDIEPIITQTLVDAGIPVTVYDLP